VAPAPMLLEPPDSLIVNRADRGPCSSSQCRKWRTAAPNRTAQPDFSSSDREERNAVRRAP
jgi:hypothetical protein